MGDTLELAVRARKLVKRYGETLAVDGIDLDIYRGECFGLLGPNGAGKTSTLKMASCVSPVTSGELLMEGKSVATDPRGVKALLGVVPQEENLDTDLTVLENLMAYARYYDMDSTTALTRAWEALFLFKLGEKAHHRIDTLSGGMKRRLLVARALIHQPSVLLLDEPTSGLDPQTRHLVWQKLITLKGQGITMLLCTHSMEEATRLCDRLVIMDQGRILAQGAPGDLVRRYVGDRVVEVPSIGERASRVTETARQCGMEVEEYGDTLYIFSPNGTVNSRASELEEEQAVVRASNLEDVFLRLAGRELKEE
ncbi:MAG: ABC transporter ATP-binding protein [Chloroflexota bacterium]